MINPRDQWRTIAFEWRERIKNEELSLITTEFVLAEVANGLSSVGYRAAAHSAIRLLEEDVSVEIVPASSGLFKLALDRYGTRPDKEWGFTDCSSFIVMEDRRLVDALTSDVHFQQAGFNALLRTAIV